MNMDDLAFRLLEPDEVRQLIRWAEKEGWNPGLYDADIFLEADPGGFYGLFHKHEMIGGGSIVSYNRLFGFMGFFIVLPEFRSEGLGRKLWYLRRDTLIKRLNPGASIGMDGVVAMQPFYQKGGFNIAFRDERYENTGIKSNLSPRITTVSENDFQQILDYDLICFGFPRSEFMLPWLKQPGLIAFKYCLEGELNGFVLMRKAISGYKICPLFAETPQIADELYKACLDAVPGEKVYIDVPVTNNAAIEMIKKHKATYVFECARMYYGGQPQIPIEKIFGLTTFELG